MTSSVFGDEEGAVNINNSESTPWIPKDEKSANGRILMLVSCVLLGITFVVGVLGNLLVCVSVYTNKSLRTPNNALLVNLAIADLLTCIFSVPILLLVYVTSITSSECPNSRTALCTVQMFFHISSSSIQLFTLASISMERYQAIARPFKTKEQKWRVIASLIASWSAGILLGVMTTLFLRNNPMYIFCNCEKSHSIPKFDIVHACVLTPLGLICLAIVLFFYGKIFEIVRKHVRDKGSLFKRRSEIDRRCIPQAEEEPEKPNRRLFSLPSWIGRRRNNKVQDSSQDKVSKVATQIEDNKVHPISIHASLHGESSHHNDSSVAVDKKVPQSLTVDKGTHISSETSFTENVTRMEDEDSMIVMMAVTLQNNSRVESFDQKDSETGENVCNDNLSGTSLTQVDQTHISRNSRTVDKAEGSNKTKTVEFDSRQNITVPQLKPLPNMETTDEVETGNTISLPALPSALSNEGHTPDDKVVMNDIAPGDNIGDSKPVQMTKPVPVKRTPSTNSLKVVDAPAEISTSNASNVMPNQEEIYGSVCVFNPKSKKTKERGRRNIEAKTAKRASYIIGVFTLCWFPLFFETFVNIVVYIPVEIEALLLSVAVLSAALNPIAYTVVNQQFRKEFIKNVRHITTLTRFCWSDE